MTWSSHVGKIASKIRRTVGVLHKLKYFLPRDVLKTIYNSLISLHLHFGVLSWGFKSSRIHRFQKKAVRTITSSKLNAHTEPLFKILHLLKISDIFNIKNSFTNFVMVCCQFFNSMYVKHGFINECTIRDSYVCRNWYYSILASRIVSIQDDAYVFFKFAIRLLVHVNINNSLYMTLNTTVRRLIELLCFSFLFIKLSSFRFCYSTLFH